MVFVLIGLLSSESPRSGSFGPFLCMYIKCAHLRPNICVVCSRRSVGHLFDVKRLRKRRQTQLTARWLPDHLQAKLVQRCEARGNTGSICCQLPEQEIVVKYWCEACVRARLEPSNIFNKSPNESRFRLASRRYSQLPSLSPEILP